MQPDVAELGLLLQMLTLLAATVAAAPVARYFGMSAIVGYLAVGILIGPGVFAFFRQPATILAIAELGVVMLLFLIGLELKLSRLLDLRRAIFGLGAAQMIVTTLVLFALALFAFGLGWRGALLAGVALAMSGTAIALQLLEERGDLQATYGQRAFGVLLFQDMAVVPILALVPLLSPWQTNDGGGFWEGARQAAIVTGVIAAVVLSGRYLLNPLFQLLAQANTREVMTAAALLLVIGTGLVMQLAGMSMALGAFLAGLLLAESNYRHELEANIEPFRGLLLALFFMGVGMSIDLSVVRAHLWLLAGGALAVIVVKTAIVWALYQLAPVHDPDGLRAAAVLTAAGEFAFVLLPIGLTLGVVSAAQSSFIVALAAVTMLVGPLFATLTDRWLARRYIEEQEYELDGLAKTHGAVLIIGFGRFGQIVSQCLSGEELDVTVIDTDTEMIQAAGRFGFKVYYGDGTRLDVLRAAHADKARLIAVCVDKGDTAERIVDIVKANFPLTKLYVRSYDRTTTLALRARDVDFEIRETFESAIAFGRATLEELGRDQETVDSTIEDVRTRDRDRLALQQAGGLYAGLEKIRPKVQPTPLAEPKRTARALNPEAEDA
ncbi:MAG TPA: monovalent cation:proton antiporter-2 (CPA2) family protein, partial [Xanthobacteraceae bacterium]|nr:monovalent cation:proton antiporter-2 (CPA2) family protein [Xanthobacteraceae bacterium]